jgi:hypothetical protein
MPAGVHPFRAAPEVFEDKESGGSAGRKVSLIVAEEK